LLEKLAQQYEAEKIGPLFLNIDSRLTSVRSPEDISESLIKALTTEKLQKVEKYIGWSRFRSLVSSLGIKIKWSSSLPFFESTLEADLSKDFRRDAENLNLTITKYENLLTTLELLPTKPVIVIGMF
jgi:hypothetical protein